MNEIMNWSYWLKPPTVFFWASHIEQHSLRAKCNQRMQDHVEHDSSCSCKETKTNHNSKFNTKHAMSKGSYVLLLFSTESKGKTEIAKWIDIDCDHDKYTKKVTFKVDHVKCACAMCMQLQCESCSLMFIIDWEIFINFSVKRISRNLSSMIYHIFNWRCS